MHIFVVFLLGMLALAHGKVYAGTNLFQDNTQWTLLSKFCFDSEGGTLTVKATTAGGIYKGQQFAFYHDMPEGGFSSVYNTGNSCGRKVQRSERAMNVSLPVFASAEGKVFDIIGGRPRWWYVVLANCHAESVALESFDIEFTNTGGKYTQQFSKDEEGVFESAIVAILVLLIEIGLLSVWFMRGRKLQGHRGHQVLAIVLVCVVVDFFGTFLQLLHFDSYSSDGVGLPDLQDFTTFLSIFPELIIIGLFVWIAKGWQISGNRPRDARSVAEMLLLYLVAAIVLYWWSFQEDDHVYVLYMYQSPPGYIMVVMRVLTCLWFLSSLSETWRFEKDSAKKSFYQGFTLFGCLWFLSLPIIVIVSEVMDTWNRKKTVEIMTHLVMYTTYFLMWLLFGYFGKTIQRLGDQHQALNARSGGYAAGGRSSIDEGDLGVAQQMETIDHDDDDDDDSEEGMTSV
jgi:hypothetical protein